MLHIQDGSVCSLMPLMLLSRSFLTPRTSWHRLESHPLRQLYSKVRKPKERGENKSDAVHFHRLCKFVEEKASKLSSLGLLWSLRTGRSLTSQLHVRYSESDTQSHFLLIFSPLATKPFYLTFIVFFEEGDKRKGPRGFLQNKSRKSIREMLLWTWLTSERRHK